MECSQEKNVNAACAFGFEHTFDITLGFYICTLNMSLKEEGPMMLQDEF